MLEKIRLNNFTAFDETEVQFSRGINIFIGENSTGKTHVLKSLYAACEITESNKSFAEKLNNVFYPTAKNIGRLVHRGQENNASLEIFRFIKPGQKAISLRVSFSSSISKPEKATISGTTKQWQESPVRSVYIPVKDMLANATGFRSMVSLRHLHFEEVYNDIIDRAFLPALKENGDKVRSQLLESLQQSMDGKVIIKGEELFLKNKTGELEFTLLAEGYRKIGLLWLLIQNGTLSSGNVLFWDEPETNLNPKLMRLVVNVLIELQRIGVQIFIATHDYVMLKEFELATNHSDKILYHAFYRDAHNHLAVNTVEQLDNLSPNAIDETFGTLIDRQIVKEMGGLGK